MKKRDNFLIDRKDVVTPKFEPTDTHVIIQVKKVKETTDGGIYLTEKTADLDQMSINEGILIKVGCMSFSELKDADVDYPKVGDAVCVKSHAGIVKYDGEQVYRIVQDVDIYVYEREGVSNENK